MKIKLKLNGIDTQSMLVTLIVAAISLTGTYLIIYICQDIYKTGLPLKMKIVSFFMMGISAAVIMAFTAVGYKFLKDMENKKCFINPLENRKKVILCGEHMKIN
jgi:hypothetical protein